MREGLIKAVEKAVDRENPASSLQRVCELLRDSVEYYNWVGFYIVEGNALVLGPYVGEPTEHVRIGFGQGICGQAAEQKSTFVVSDVAAERNYLSCSAKVRAEIVVPVFRDGHVCGEIDIDSHTLNPFSTEDTVLLERVAELVAPLVG